MPDDDKDPFAPYRYDKNNDPLAQYRDNGLMDKYKSSEGKPDDPLTAYRPDKKKTPKKFDKGGYEPFIPYCR